MGDLEKQGVSLYNILNISKRCSTVSIKKGLSQNRNKENMPCKNLTSDKK